MDSSIGNDYFCNTIPSRSGNLINDLKGLSGTAQITVEINKQDDNDGIAAAEEDLNKNGNLEDDDTDGDSIPNYIDQDDDNDNILTSAELPNQIPNDDSPRDSDQDGIPDYLDADDDNDGVETIREDTDQNGNPRDDDANGNGIPNYLDNTDIIPTENMPSQKNTVETTFRTTVVLLNLEFDKESKEFDTDSFTFGTIDQTIQVEN